MQNTRAAVAQLFLDGIVLCFNMETPVTLTLGSITNNPRYCMAAFRVAESCFWWKREFIVSGFLKHEISVLAAISIFRERR